MKTRTRRWAGVVVVGTMAAGLLAAPAARAVEYVWNTTTGNWTDTLKWTPNAVPGAADTAWIGKTGTTAQVVTILANQDVQGFKFWPDNAGNLCAVTVDGVGFTLNLGSGGLDDNGSRGGTSRTINPNILLTAAQDWQSGDNRCPMYINGTVSGSFTITRKGNGYIFVAKPNPGFSGTVISQDGGAFVLNGNGATLGTGSFTFAGSGVGASTTAVGASNVGVYALANDITVTAASTLRSDGLMQYTGNFNTGAANNLTIAGVYNTNYGVFSIEPGAGKSYTASTGTTAVSGAGYSVNKLSGGTLTLNSGNLNIGGGILVLNNTSWADLMTNRSGGYNTSGANTWQYSGSGGFAARGAPVEITAGNGVTSSTFNKNFTLGITTRKADGSLFADQPVTVNVDTNLTAVRTVSVPSTGAGATNNPYTVAQVLKGTWSGTGALLMAAANTVGIGSGTWNSTLPELVLAGSNSWTGGISADLGGGTRYLNSGPGGLLQQDWGFVRFDGQSSLPTGNGGSTAYIGSICGGGSDGEGLRRGVLFTGGPGAGKSYSVGNGYKLLIGADRSTSGDTSATSFGSTGGRAVLQGMDIYLHSYPGASSTTGVIVRDGELVLGAPGQAVRLIATQGVDAAASATATAVVDGTSAGRGLKKMGPGTLVLQNFTYNKLDGSDNKSGANWNVGFTVGKGYNNVFDGAIRETGTGASNSARFSNAALTLVGGVLELDGADFTRGLDNSAGNIDAAWSGGMGFAAHGGNRYVNIFGSATPSRIDWGGSNRLFVAATSDTPLIFGSTTADSTLDFRNPFNLNVGSGSVDRYIKLVRGVGTVPEAQMSGGIVNTGAGTANLIVSGYTGLGAPAAGTLVLSSANNNTYNGTTTIQNGATLLVNGALSNSAAMVTVKSTATLGGTGTINRPVTVETGGTLAPGASPGILTIGNGQNLVLSTGSNFAVQLGGNIPGLYDQLNVGGDASLGGNMQLSFYGNFINPAQTDAFYILNRNSGSGTFAGLLEGAYLQVPGSGYVGQITYLANWTGTQAGSALFGGNDVALFNLIPEPGTFGLLVLGALALARSRSRFFHRAT